MSTSGLLVIRSLGRKVAGRQLFLHTLEKTGDVFQTYAAQRPPNVLRIIVAEKV
jgi:hypothetical protein